MKIEKVFATVRYRLQAEHAVAIHRFFFRLGKLHFMELGDLDLHQIIEKVTVPHTAQVVEAAVELWERLATQIISIVGEGGFDSLYARSVFLAQATFPWLAANSISPTTDHRFAELKTTLEGQTPAQAGAANNLLLITFTGILASLIGEQLTTSILRSAWADDASNGCRRNSNE